MQGITTFLASKSDEVMVKMAYQSIGYVLVKRASEGSENYIKTKIDVTNLSDLSKAIDVRLGFAGAAVASLAMMTYQCIMTAAVLIVGVAALVFKQNSDLLDVGVKQMTQFVSNVGFGAIGVLGVIAPSIGADCFKRVNEELIKRAPIESTGSAVKGVVNAMGDLGSTVIGAARSLV